MIDVSALDVWHRHSYNTRTRGKDYKGQIKGSCRSPWRNILVHRTGDLLLCLCDGWLPISVGKVLDFNSIDEVFNSSIAKELQQDISDKKFTHCAVTDCGVIEHDYTFPRTQLIINIDESCNLACPSCRREQIMLSEGEQFEYKLKSIERILTWLENFNEDILITMSGNGDCLASHIMRPIIRNYKPKHNQKFSLFTNGLLMKKLLPGVPMLSQVEEFKISVDAGSADVYKIVRQPGIWSNLLENFDWLDANRGTASVRLMFTVQQKNYRDIPAFIKLCTERDYVAELTPLDDWATWDSPNKIRGSGDPFSIKNGTLKSNDVLNPAHPEHQQCLDILKEVQQIPNKILFNSRVKALL